LLEELPGGTEVEPPHMDAKPAAPAEPDEPTAETDDELLGPLVPADLPDKDVEVVSSDEPVDAEPEEDDTITEAVVAEDEVVVPDPLTDQGDEFQDDELPPEEPPPDEPAAEDGPPVDKPPPATKTAKPGAARSPDKG
jgi:hypothetical protein